MTRKTTLPEFITKARLKHGDLYDYSKVDYIKSNIKVIIICNKHGEFPQKPEDHLTGHGCPFCRIVNRRSTTVKFIKSAKLIHSERYDYSNVDYIKNNTEVIIICKLHGEFPQKPDSHLSGSGCPLCGGKVKSTSDFIKKAKLVHGNKYNYSKVDFINALTEVIIFCKIHGEFPQKPHYHLCGTGCIKCTGRVSSTEEFIVQANLIHNNKYDYSKVVYVKSDSKIILHCNKHGDFPQIPNSHLNGSGCSKCNSMGHSQKSINWIESIMQSENIFIQHAGNIGEHKIKTTRYKADGYCESTNTIYEFYGDYYHGNTNIYTSDFYNTLIYKTMGELYQKTIDREQKIKNLGYNLVVMWESDYNKLI
jgi:hypothetical protein